MVYVISKDGQPLMPTERYGKVYRLLKSGMAKVVRRTPFTIQLQYETVTNITQPISLGIDTGSKHVGLSATTENKVLYEANIELRNHLVELIASRRALRRARRSRKTRYRMVRFDNRKRLPGWLPPSIRQKVECHMKVVLDAYRILPITRIIVEIASFDIQKINNPNVEGNSYQQGEQFGFWNVREYVLYRDDHTCRCCKGKSKDKILNIHHIESRKTGGDAPNNLITLCKTCHDLYHQDKIQFSKMIKRGRSFRDETFMGIMKWDFYNQLKKQFPDVSLTYGYITKHVRIKNKLPKAHYIDARCISGNPLAVSDGFVYHMKKIRCHNRRIHNCKIDIGGIRRRQRMSYIVCGFRLFDKVKWDNKIGFISSRRQNGYFRLCSLDGQELSSGVSFKKLHFLETRRSYIIDKICAGGQTVKSGWL